MDSLGLDCVSMDSLGLDCVSMDSLGPGLCMYNQSVCMQWTSNYISRLKMHAKLSLSHQMK